MNRSRRTSNNYGYIHDAVDPAFGNSPLVLNGTAAFNTYGTFDFTADGSVVGGANSSFGIFPNGFLTKSFGSGMSTINAPTTNDAVIEAQTGTIVLAGSGTHHGTFFPDPGATIAFGANNTTLINAGIFGPGNIAFLAESTSDIDAVYDIGGTTSIAHASVTFESSAQTTDFVFNDAGSLGLFAAFAMTGTGTWSAGTIQYDDGDFIVAPGAILTIDSANGITKLDTAVIENEGTINYTATGTVLAASARRPAKALTTGSGYYMELDNSSTIYNDGVFDIQTDSPIVSGASIMITGSGACAKNRRHPAAAALPLMTTARGRVITHRARTMGMHVRALCGCPNDIENQTGATLQKSAGSGTTDVGPDFGNSGAMKALSGTLNFQGGYFQDDGATTLGPGNIQSAFAMDIEGGIVDGAGRITGDVDNYGEVKPGTAAIVGTINITGNF